MGYSKDIEPKNKEGRWHGYCELYRHNGQLNWAGVMVNGENHGYFKYYDYDGSIDKYRNGYWMNHRIRDKYNKEGYCYIWNKVDL